jgi:outer membrane protein assembly factor BamB
MKSRQQIAVFAVAAALSNGLMGIGEGRAENWPQWRGARGDGVSQESNLPTTWTKSEGVAWRLPLPGPAGATPVVWGDKIFLTSADGSNLVLMCVSTDGKELWRQVMGDGNKDVRGDEGNSASPSPSTDGKHVWAMMGGGQLGCYTINGKPVWNFNLQERYGQFNIQFGMTSTPVLDGDRLYLQIIHSGGAGVVCLNAQNGKEIWKQNRPSDARDECEHSYASPMICREGKQELLLTHGADYIVAHRLKDGAELWRCGGLNPPGNYNHTLRLVASPVAADGVIIVPSAKNGPVLALTPDNKGDVTNAKNAHLWDRPHDTPDVPSPLIYDGLAYLCRENGTLIVLDAKTGEEVYQKRVHSDRHRASPVYGDGKIYMTARDGTVSVVKAGREFEVLSKNKMEESTSSSPAIAGGRIYVRTFAALYAIGK